MACTFPLERALEAAQLLHVRHPGGKVALVPAHSGIPSSLTEGPAEQWSAAPECSELASLIAYGLSKFVGLAQIRELGSFSRPHDGDRLIREDVSPGDQWPSGSFRN
jgi:hypothetical protein